MRSFGLSTELDAGFGKQAAHALLFAAGSPVRSRQLEGCGKVGQAGTGLLEECMQGAGLREEASASAAPPAPQNYLHCHLQWDLKDHSAP